MKVVITTQKVRGCMDCPYLKVERLQPLTREGLHPLAWYCKKHYNKKITEYASTDEEKRLRSIFFKKYPDWCPLPSASKKLTQALEELSRGN